MQSETKQTALNQPPRLLPEIIEWARLFPAEFGRCWRLLPNKGVFFPLLIAWLLLFQFLGNATFGYIDTSSLLYWMKNAYFNSMNEAEDIQGLFIPPLVVALLWWKRKALLGLSHRLWWPAIFLLAGALALHVVGYLIQQPRVSIVALFAGIYALGGLAWGPAWLRASWFPFILFIFCVPVSSVGEPVTVPLRLFATRIVAFICNHIFGMDVHCEGNLLYNSAHTYQYEVAAACSGMRSLVAILLLTVVYAFMCFDRAWKSSLIILSALPLAVIGNVLRLMCIVVAAEVWGGATGNSVHDSWFFSLLPYVPAIFGVLFLGRWLGERPPEPNPASSPQPL